MACDWQAINHICQLLKNTDMPKKLSEHDAIHWIQTAHRGIILKLSHTNAVEHA